MPNGLALTEVVAGGLRQPVGIAIDENDALIVSDRKLGVILRIAEGRTEPLVQRLERPVGLALTVDDRLLIAEEGKGRLLRLETDGTLTVLTDRLRYPRWVAVRSDGVAYISAQELKPDRRPSGRRDHDDDDDNRRATHGGA